MNKVSPEAVGISSRDIYDYVNFLEEKGLATHDMLLMRHGKLVFEAYWKPFHQDFLHRMYSVTKSFVGLALGFLAQDGLVDLDAPISTYFPEETKDVTDENLKAQTVRHMLMMTTAKPPQGWMDARCEDRVKFYFENKSKVSRPSGTIFQYDSSGSFVLGALVERKTGKTLLDYLREKFLDKIGFSKEAYCLKCPGGHSWSDSALLCTPRDLLKVAKFCLDKGRVDGEQVLNEAYITAACGNQISNVRMSNNQCTGFGYGYLIWRTFDNSFFFNGMGCQFAVCVPEKDLIFIYNGDNQAVPFAKDVIMENFFTMIARKAADHPLSEDQEGVKALERLKENLSLFALKGKTQSPMAEEINGVTYTMAENPMGITQIKVTLKKDGGVFAYTNAQGDKEIPFGMGKNVFATFPQDGYSDAVGAQKGNRRYACASSAVWTEEKQLMIHVQIIDTYFGKLRIVLGFQQPGKVGLWMEKKAENFLWEYEGFAGGIACNDGGEQ